jgi:hypothetical protein
MALPSHPMVTGASRLPDLQAMTDARSEAPCGSEAVDE